MHQSNVINEALKDFGSTDRVKDVNRRAIMTHYGV
jgi:hypothetical protein